MASATPYVNCANCEAPFNPLTTMWCSCLVSERTLVCPNCLKCFCRASTAYKNQFWQQAPATLLQRRVEEYAKSSLPPQATTAGGPLRRPLVLVVDDEPAILRLAIRAVRGQGCGVLWADNGADAFELARAHHPDLVLTDALMPRLDGRELCRTLKSDPDLKGIKVVVMTGVYTTTSDAHQGRLEYGVDDYLAKPIDFVELGLLLKKHTGAEISNT